MTGIPKKVRRVLSADESLRRYFGVLQAQLDKHMQQRWRLVSVERLRPDGMREVLQVTRILESSDGVIVEVR